ncbi:hypothetical protein EYZ11_009165 [Aspergillus tanneri]|uniref:Uncharacterized protein n=1 Tax=Aspergillus tanneri TaxID=1220188 RepID=A0A4S3J8S7_9EURO|nr:uncharacterized protein ATNIH1004_004107 [Aspergillus tanneri]KAA8648224.1 hypothetical protein ATNIH1004_004107 [Aspergillus tanneri]THC91380.1 hypothetical protein EYZ11_009165 [Aspergillus tanneri]
MKPSTVLLCLVPTIAFAVDTEHVPPAVDPILPLPNTTPPVPLPEVQIPSTREDEFSSLLEPRHMVRMARPAPVKQTDGTITVAPEDTVPTTILDQWPELSQGRIGLRRLDTSPGGTKALRARSEGTLGQTPWIGMAIGLTCTGLTAVMLG